MSIRTRLIRYLINYLWRKFPYLVRDVLYRQGKHIQGHKVTKA